MHALMQTCYKLTMEVCEQLLQQITSITCDATRDYRSRIASESMTGPQHESTGPASQWSEFAVLTMLYCAEYCACNSTDVGVRRHLSKLLLSTISRSQVLAEASCLSECAPSYFVYFSHHAAATSKSQSVRQQYHTYARSPGSAIPTLRSGWT